MLRWAVKECERRGLESNEPDSQRRCLGEALFLIRYLTFAGTLNCEIVNSHIFQVLITAGRAISGIFLELGPMTRLYEVVSHAKYFWSPPTRLGVGPPPRFWPTV